MLYHLTVFKVRKGVKNPENFTGSHIHNFFQLVYIHSGKGSIRLLNKFYQTDPGDMFFIPPFTDHEIFGFKNFTTIHISFFCKNSLNKKLMSLKKHYKNLELYEASIIQDIFTESIMSHPFHKEIIQVRLYELILRLLRAAKTEKKSINSNINVILTNLTNDINNVLNYIEENIYSNIEISQIADYYGFSESYFSHCFKDAVGCSPKKYITLRKMKIAKDLLFTSKMNVTQISEHLGFSSVHYFSRVFKMHFGVSPKHFFNTNDSELVVKFEQKLKVIPEEIASVGGYGEQKASSQIC
ncbi:MAG: AraC family transcriptional regulator [Acetivibrionales bacterium]